MGQSNLEKHGLKEIRHPEIERRERLFKEVAELEKELDELRAKGVSEEGIAAFRRLYPQFKRIFGWED